MQVVERSFAKPFTAPEGFDEEAPETFEWIYLSVWWLSE